jgi:glucokinase
VTARCVGLDIGGTQVKVGVVEDGAPRRAEAMDTLLERGADDFLDRLAARARALGARDALGVGCPGVFDAASGALSASANLHALEGRDLRVELAERTGIAPECIGVGNDANLAAYGEQWMGAGREHRDLCLVTLGTGIGGGLVLGGALITGPQGTACEVGHVVVRPRDAGGLPCGCGSYGCLETLASATAAQRRAREAGLADDLKLLCAAARAGDGPERALLHAIGRDLGAGLSYVVSLLDIGFFVIGGGFSGALDVLAPGVHEVLAERRYGTRAPTIVRAALGEDAGWIGAARLASELRAVAGWPGGGPG